MKYIRTKDGVYELKVNEELKAQKTSNYFYINDKRFTCNLLLDEKYVKKCKQSDTIEELCDIYIEEYLDYKSVILKSDLYRGEDGSWRKEVGLPEHKIKIYGAIWVGVDLKSIAKMNKKGELELL